MKIPIDPLILVPFVTGLFRLWVKTIRYEPHGDWENLLKMNKEGQSLVVSFWHGELFPVTGFAHKISQHYVAVVSQSKDGEIIAQILERLGTKPVRGSSSRGGVKALLHAKRIMEKENRIAVFTVDGPRGPRHKPKDGVIFMAQRAGAKIIPIRAYPKTKKIFGSWDRFMLPMPFTRCPIYIGEPMDVTTEKLDKEVMAREKERLEKRMLALGANENE